MLLERLDIIADHLERATLVQDHSVRIIKQVCAINAEEVRAVRAGVAQRIEELEAANDALQTACDNVVAALNCKYDSATIEAEYGEQLRALTKGG